MLSEDLGGRAATPDPTGEDGRHLSGILVELNDAENDDEVVGRIIDDAIRRLDPANRAVPTAPYVASHIKRAAGHQGRHGASGRRRLIDIVEQSQPCTVRQVFYQATVRGMVEKTEAGYAKVQRQLVDLRRAGRIPFCLDRRQHPLAPQADDASTASTEAVEHCARTYYRQCRLG